MPNGPVPVLLMIHSLGHGGSERQLANFALAMDRSRFMPHVACVEEGFHAEALRQAGIPVVPLALKSFLSPGFIGVAREMRAYIRAQGIRLVHAFDYTLTIAGVPIGRTCPGTVVLSSQRCYVELVPAKYRRLMLLAHRLADGVVVNCEALRRNLAGDCGVAERRIQVCYNGLDTERFSPAGRARLPGLEDASLVIGTACVLRPEKNLAHLVHAFARVRGLRAGMRLLIVGSGPERERLVNLATELGIVADCLFLPSTPDVAEVMRGIDVFVHPSLTEGLPNGVMEAMACGCAVVASGVGGCPELIEDGASGLLAEAGNLESLVRQLGAAVTDDGLRERVGQGAAARMKDFSVEKAARRMEEIYRGYLALSE